MTFIYQLILFGLPGVVLLVSWRKWAKADKLSPPRMAFTGGTYVLITMSVGSFLFLGVEFTDVGRALARGLVFAIPVGLILYLGGRKMREEKEQD